MTLLLIYLGTILWYALAVYLNGEMASGETITASIPVTTEEVVTKEKYEKPKKAPSTSKLEEKIKKCEEKIASYKKSQFEEEVYTNPNKMKEIDDILAKLQEELNALEEEYLLRE